MNHTSETVVEDKYKIDQIRELGFVEVMIRELGSRVHIVYSKRSFRSSFFRYHLVSWRAYYKGSLYQPWHPLRINEPASINIAILHIVASSTPTLKKADVWRISVMSSDFRISRLDITHASNHDYCMCLYPVRAP